MGQDLRLRYYVADEMARIFVQRRNPAGSTTDLQAIEPAQRPALSFRCVNLPDRPGYDPGLQRHHLLPRQLLSQSCFAALFDQLARRWPGLDDFRSNGMLLPCNAAAALRMGLPLHRGPHRDYNVMVIERVGEVEALWSSMRPRTPLAAHREAVAGLKFLQQELRRGLLDPGRKRLALNRQDPLGQIVDYSEIDAMVDALWSASDCRVGMDFLTDQKAVFKPAIPLPNFKRAANAAWA